MGTLEQLLLEIGNRFAPLSDRIQNKEIVLLLNELGLPVQESANSIQGFILSISDLHSNLLALLSSASDLKSAIAANNLEDIVSASAAMAGHFKSTFAGIEAFTTSIRNDIGAAAIGISQQELETFLSDLPKKLFDYLVITNIENVSSPLADVLEFLKVIDRPVVTLGNNPPVTHRTLNFSALVEFVSDPPGHFAKYYDWNTPEFDGTKLFKALSKLLLNNGIPVIYDETNLPGALNAIFVQATADTSRPVPGVLIEPAIDAKLLPDFVVDKQEWKFVGGIELKLSSSAQLSFFPDGSVQVNMPQFQGGKIDASFEAGYPDKPFDLISLPGGSKLEANRFKSDLNLELSTEGTGAFRFSAEMTNIHLVIDLSNGDKFVKNVTSGSSKKIESEFDLKFGYSAEAGFYIQGSGALEINLPAHVSIGPIELDSLTIRIQPGNGAIPVTAGGNIKTVLGPLKVLISDIGLKATLSFPDDHSGNLGPVDLGVGFKPPTGIGLSVDGGGFKGGGFLRFEPELERYTGALELEFQDKIALKAIGLLETRLPGNPDGFSLLIIITAEFNPVPLGFGFTLNGVGGLLGLNRIANFERLRTGIRDNSLSSILFPQNIVENAPRIISDVGQAFPPQQGRFVFGPMAKIGWGTPTLLTIDLGLILEVPNPPRLAILGVLKGAFPKEDAPVLRLQVNFLGEIDFEKKQFLFDASLYDSKLLAFSLSGDMAIRVFWGEDPNFLLTVGGFHPAYQPPPMRLPDIRRITLALIEGDNPRLRLETYFAVTSNSVQFGAKAEVYASAWKFNVCGFIAFDVLFQFNPFRFIAEVSAMLALRVGSSPFASIQLAFALEGPTPWSARGTASFRICWFFTLKVRFSKTWGDNRNDTLPDVQVMPLLLAALNDNNNWTAELPRGRHALVSAREVVPQAGGDQKIVAQPYGVLNVSQKVVPLNLTIQKFGNLRPADGNQFRISGVQVGQHMDIPNPEPAKEYFAPAQFFEKTDAEKLSDKSFERYDSGFRLMENGQLKTAYAAARKVQYELTYIDSQRNEQVPKPEKDPHRPDAGAFNTWALQGAVSKSELSHTKNRTPALAPEPVALAQEQFAVVYAHNLQLFDSASLAGSELEAYETANYLTETDPSLRGKLQVVPIFEMNP